MPEIMKKLIDFFKKYDNGIAKLCVKFLEDNSVLWQFLRSGVVGAIATVVDYLVLLFFEKVVFTADWKLYIDLIGENVDLSLILATALGFVAGLFVNYYLSLFFVFTKDGDLEKGKKGSSLLIFTGVGIIGLILTTVGMQIGAAIFGDSAFNLLIEKIVVTVIVFVWNYLGRRIFIFK